MYSIESGETDPTQRYTMKLTKEEAKMSSHITTLIQLSEQTNDHSCHFGSVDFMDAASMKKLEAYIKHYTHDEIPKTDLYKTCYQLATIPHVKGRLILSDYDKSMLFECDPASYTNLARGALYFGMTALIFALQKYYATIIFAICNYNELPHFGAGYGGISINPCRFFALYCLFDIEHVNDDEMTAWKKSLEYNNFMSMVFSEIAPNKIYQSLADILSLTQRENHSYMYYLGAYFPKIIQLLLPYLDGVIDDGVHDEAYVLPNCDDMCFQLYCNNTVLEGNTKEKVKILNIENETITKIPPEIANFINLEYINVSGCHITTLPKELALLEKAMKFSFKDCMIRSLPIELKHMVENGKIVITGNPINYNHKPAYSELINLLSNSSEANKELFVYTTE